MAKKKESVMAVGEVDNVDTVDNVDAGQSAIDNPQSEISRWLDVVVTEQPVVVKLSDDRLLEIARDACDKHQSAAKLKADIAAFKEARKDMIKAYEQEAGELDAQFADGTECIKKEVRIIKNFELGRIRVEVIESGEIVEDREMTSSECQREFALILDADPSDQLLQRAADICRMALPMAVVDGEPSDVGLAREVAFRLAVSDSFAGRLVARLRELQVLSELVDGLVVRDSGRECEDCIRCGESGDNPECVSCQEDDVEPVRFEKPDVCNGCRFKRTFMVFAPCASCDPNVGAKGFEAMPME